MKTIVYPWSTKSDTNLFYLKALRQMDINLIDIPFDPRANQAETKFPSGDLLLLVDCGLPVIFPELENYRYRKDYVSIDSCHKIDIHQQYCNQYKFDHIWVAQKHMVNEFNGNASWLPLGADEETHSFRPDMLIKTPLHRHYLSRPFYQIGMCAASYKHRKEFKKLFQSNGLTTNFHFRKRFMEEVTVELAKCTIGFNCAAGFTGEKGKDIPMRVFETMANGNCMLITNYYKDLGYDDLFKEGIHYANYTCKEEALDKVNYYVNNPLVAGKIANNSKKYILENHTYKIRAKKIIQKL